MSPSMQVSGQPLGKFRVGQKVRIKHGHAGVIGEIVEGRGPIGVGRRRLYGIRMRLDPWNEILTERPEESLEAVTDEPNGAPLSDTKKSNA